MRMIHQFLDYAATHPDEIITFSASNMVLTGHRDASYLSETKACSRASGKFFLSNNSTNPPKNGDVPTVAPIIKPVMSSVAKVELGALYIKFREFIPARHAPIVIGHPQPPTPMQNNNTTAMGVINNIIAPRRTKAMDMRFHWLHCRACQLQFWHYWRPGSTNKGDFVTNHHAEIHHKMMLSQFLSPERTLDSLRHGSYALLTRSTVRVC